MEALEGEEEEVALFVEDERSELFVGVEGADDVFIVVVVLLLTSSPGCPHFVQNFVSRGVPHFEHLENKEEEGDVVSCLRG